MTELAKTVRVRDLATDVQVNLSGAETALRVPYEILMLDGPARVEGDGIRYSSRGTEQTGRAKEAHLGECAPGERVLLRERTLAKTEAGWWLCEVIASDGRRGRMISRRRETAVQRFGFERRDP